MKITLVFKGMLLWITAFTIIFFISGLDSIIDNGYFIQSLAVCIVLCFACYKFISEEEFEILSLYKWAEKYLGDGN